MSHGKMCYFYFAVYRTRELCNRTQCAAFSFVLTLITNYRGHVYLVLCGKRIDTFIVYDTSMV
jgi:hypothetical protein